METRFTLLLIELGVAIAIQIALLVAVLVVVRRGAKRMESLIAQVEKLAVPALDSTKAILETSRPLVEETLRNASQSSAMLRQQMERADATLNDILDRTRLQVIRADELATRAMDRVEETTEAVAGAVASPVRKVAGIVQGVATGFGVLFGRHARARNGGPQDSMFI